MTAPKLPAARLREALERYEDDPVNAYDKPSSWAKLEHLLETVRQVAAELAAQQPPPAGEPAGWEAGWVRTTQEGRRSLDTSDHRVRRAAKGRGVAAPEARAAAPPAGEPAGGKL